MDRTRVDILAHIASHRLWTLDADDIDYAVRLLGRMDWAELCYSMQAWHKQYVWEQGCSSAEAAYIERDYR